MKRALEFTFAALLVAVATGQLLADPQNEKSPAEQEAEIQAALAELPGADKVLAEAQRFCVTMPRERLGAMGAPKKIMLNGKPVFLCCEGCEKQAKANPKATLQTVEQMKKANAALAKLSKEDRLQAEQQMNCPVSSGRLGSMGTPPKLTIEGQPVFICCKGCERKAMANPKATLAKVVELKKADDE
ncbi:MAG TPA: hypothetical protein VFE62_23030 [Gemmataceae bacterium]|nr:hypothetical protein [Gemmataceae bacterium]